SVSSCRVVRQGSSCPEIAERHIGLVMEVARTSMIHAAAPHFLWPFADVMFDESVPFYRLFPYRSAPSPPLSLFLAPGPPPLDPLPRQGPTPSGVSQVDPLLGTAPVQVAVVSGAAPGAASGGAASGGVELEGAGSEGAGSGGAEPEGVEHGGESGDTGAGGAAVTTGAGDPTEPGAAGARGAGAGVAGVGGPGAGGARAAGAGAVDPGAGAAGGTVQPWPRVVLGGHGRTDPLLKKPFYPSGLVVGILTWYSEQVPSWERFFFGAHHENFFFFLPCQKRSSRLPYLRRRAPFPSWPVAALPQPALSRPLNARRWLVATRRGPTLAAHYDPVPPVAGPSRPVPACLGPTRPVPALCWPVLAPLPQLVGRSPPIIGPFATRRGLCLSAPCSCRPLSHETLHWHHRLGHPSLPRLRGMASRTLCAAPHSSTFPPTEAPLQTLHMDVWGPAHVPGQGHEPYFLLVVDDYSRYTIVFPLRRKGEVLEVLIDWIHGARCQLSERFGSDLPVLRLHSDRGGEFSSDLLRAFCRPEGIRQTFTLPASPQQNGIAERCIGMVMDVARTSMIHAAAPHFLWPFAVQHAAHQINLQPRVSLPETTPTLSGQAVPCVFLGFPPDAPEWQFYHPTSRRVLSSQDVTFDESGSAPSGVSQVDLAEPVEVAVDSGAARGAEPERVESGGAEPERVEPGGAESERVEPGGAESGGTESGGAEPAHAQSGGFPGATGAGAAGGAACARAAGAAASAGAAGGATGAGAAGGAAGAGAAGATCLEGAHTGGTGADGAGGTAGVGAVGSAAGGAAGVVIGHPRAEGTSVVSAVSGGAPASPLPGPSPYSGPTRGLTERREPESRPVSPVSRSVSPVQTARAGRRALHPRLPPDHGTHSMILRPSTAPQRVPLLSPPASSLPDGPDPESDSLRAACSTVTCFLATVVSDPLFESTTASALVAQLVDFAAACRLDYATSLVAEPASASVCSLQHAYTC
ncbi:unnamed protein product, partial [Closterium sp. NIES-54]